MLSSHPPLGVEGRIILNKTLYALSLIRATCIALIILLYLVSKYQEPSHFSVHFKIILNHWRITTTTFVLPQRISLAQRLKQATRPSIDLSLFIPV